MGWKRETSEQIAMLLSIVNHYKDFFHFQMKGNLYFKCASFNFLNKIQQNINEYMKIMYFQ